MSSSWVPYSTMRPSCEHGDAVGVAHGGDAVRDEDGGAALHDLAQVIEDALFGLGVDAGERIVEHQDARIANHRAGDGGALLLAAGKSDAALANHRVVSLGKTLDVPGDVGSFGDAADLGVVASVRAEGNVFADGVAEQKSLLRHEADILAQQCEGNSRMGRPSISTEPGAAS